MATIISSIGMLFILLIKKWLKNHITARWQYYIGLLSFVLLLAPLVPSSLYASLRIIQWSGALNLERGITTIITTTTGDTTVGTYGIANFQNFAVSVNSIAPGYLFMLLMMIWIVGIIVSVVIAFTNNKNLRLIKESITPIKESEILSLFIQCKVEVGIKDIVALGSSIMVKTPMTIGFIKPFIILPAKKMPMNDMRFAMLHELIHCKNKDIPINSLMYVFQILYWFNPLVYLVFKQMRLDRELACDALVLGLLPKESHISYGETLVHFAKSLSSPSILTFATGIGDSRPHLIKRVRYIASYSRESSFLKIKSILLFFMALLLIFCKVPIISALTINNENQFSFAFDNVYDIDLSKYFGDINGSFVLYDVGAGSHTIHNQDMGITRVSPTSTYKIVSTLIALETGVLESSNTEREWDGAMHPFDVWNQNHNLISAMNSSVNWYFQNLDAVVGVEQLSYFLKQQSYGNHDISGGLTDFWIESSLKISPIEQVLFLVSLYQNDTVFQPEHVNTTMNALRLSEKDGAVLSGKTGTGIIGDVIVSGWFIGLVETNDNTFIFATYIQGNDYVGGSVAAQISLSILESKGIF